MQVHGDEDVLRDTINKDIYIRFWKWSLSVI